MTNSLLVNASRALLSSTACDTAKSPALPKRWNCLCSRPWLVALDKKVNDWVRTRGKGADSRRSYMPTTVGVGYSLMPRIAPTRVPVGVRYSIASAPKSSRVVANDSFSDARGIGIRCHSPLTSEPRYSSNEEHQALPDL